MYWYPLHDGSMYVQRLLSTGRNTRLALAFSSNTFLQLASPHIRLLVATMYGAPTPEVLSPAFALTPQLQVDAALVFAVVLVISPS